MKQKITVNYQKKPSDPVPAYIAKIQNNLNVIAGLPGTLNSDLTNRNGNYSINVIYGGTTFDGFVATDGQTLKVHDSWLSANATTISNADISDGLRAMLNINL